MSEERVDVDGRHLVKQSHSETKPIIAFEPGSTLKEVVDSMRKLLPEDKFNQVTLVTFAEE